MPVIDGTSGNDSLTGTSEPDRISGLEGDDSLYGGDGDDLLIGGPGTNILDGGAGSDTADYSWAPGGVILRYNQPASFPGGSDTLQSIEIVIGSAFRDIIESNLGGMRLEGGGGSDSLQGFYGPDSLYGGTGDDFLSDRLNPEAPVADLFDGGEGSDVLILENTADAGIHIDLRVEGVAQDTHAGGWDVISGIEHLSTSTGFTTAGDDVLVGTDAGNWFETWGGNDQLAGNGGDDQFTIVFGVKVIDGGAGSDLVELSQRRDVFPMPPRPGVTISLELQGEMQFSYELALNLTSIENLEGGGGSDVLIGDGQANMFAGNGGDDWLKGGAGDDILSGDGDFRRIFTEDGLPLRLMDGFWSGSDTLEGGLGADRLIGGGAADTFVGTVAEWDGDTIADFRAGDRIIVSDAEAGAFTFSLTSGVVTFGDASVRLEGLDPRTLLVSEASGGGVQLALPTSQFAAPTFELAAFGRDVSAGGWVLEDRYPRRVADVNGDGMTDLLGFGEDGVFVSLATGDGNYGPATFTFAGFGASVAAGGWNYEGRYPRMLADVNGDQMADIVGFGEDGVFVSLATGDGQFGVSTFALAGFGAGSAAGGWNWEGRYPRELADVNGDGMADIVGFGEDGVFVALASGGGSFGTPTYTYDWFGASAAAGGWNDENRYARELADVNNDGMADIVGFAEAGVFVALATGDGHFGPGTFAVADFGAGEGWTGDELYPRALADVDGDGNVDIAGFGEDGVWISYGHGDGTFDAAVQDIAAFGTGQGWTSQSAYPRHLGDTNGDGAADIIAFAGGGVFVSLSNGDIWV